MVIDAENWLYAIYGFGSNAVKMVVKNGKVVVEI